MIYGDIFHQKLQLVNSHAVEGMRDYLEFKFCFRTEDWNGLEKWAHFSCGDTAYDIPLTDDRICKEDHLNLSAGEWSIFLHGNEYRSGMVFERITTETALLTVEATGTQNGELFPEIPVSVTERLLARLNFIESHIKSGDSETFSWEVRTLDEFKQMLAAGYSSITLAPDADITVSQTIDLPEGTVILGSGATIRRAAGFEEGLLNLSAGCRIENLTIEGNRSEMKSPYWNRTFEINLKTDAQGCVIENITINNGNEGIIVSGYDNIVRGCKLYDCGGNGIHFGSAYRCRAEGCTIIGANKNASVMGNSRGCIYICMVVEDVDVVNCYCEDGLAGVGGLDAPDNARIKVTGCTVKNCTQAVEGYIGEGGGAAGLIFTGNQFIDCGSFIISDTNRDYPPSDGLIVSDNIFTETPFKLRGCRRALISGNTFSAKNAYPVELMRCPYCIVSDNIVDSPNDIAIHITKSPHISVSNNIARCLTRGVHAEDSEGILLFGNVFRQYPNTSGYDIVKLLRCPESAVDNNKMYAYSGDGFSAESNCRTMGNYIVVADSSMIAIRVWGGHANYIVAQNMSNGTFAVASGTNAVVQNNITITSDAFKAVTFSLVNITASGLAKCLTDDDYSCTLTAAGGYTLPDAITVTMGGTTLAAGTGYTYDKAAGRVTVYRVSGAVEITAGV